MESIDRFLRSRCLRYAVVMAAAMSTGCAPKFAALSSPDPSDPTATVQGDPYRPSLEPESRAPAPAAADPHAAHEHGTDEPVFACPMHPDVTGAEGDKCHLCGMTLVPKKEPQK